MKQRFRFTDDELDLITNTFNEEQYDLLKAIKKVFLQGELTDLDKQQLEKLTPDAVRIIRKTILPEIDPDSPLNQTVDLWSNINTKDQDPESAWLDMMARAIVVTYLDERLKTLAGEKVEMPLLLKDLEFDMNKSKEQAFISLSARNTLINHIDYQLLQLMIVAGSKADNSVEVKKRLIQKNSNR